MDFLSEVEKKLDLPPGEKAQVIRELRSHYEELRGELVASGMDADLAAREAARKLGDPADVASRLRAIHCRATWKSALLTAFPFVAGLIGAAVSMPLYRQIRLAPATSTIPPDLRLYWVGPLTVAVLFAGLLLAGSIRELLHNRRPVWLATWLAVGVLKLISVVTMLEFLSGRFPLQHPGAIYVSNVFTILLLGMIAAAAFRRSSKWSMMLAGWTLISLATYAVVGLGRADVPGGPSMFGLIMLLLAPMIMAIALGVFVRHPYSNSTQALLFLFAFYAGIHSYPVLHVPSVMHIVSLLPTIVVMAVVIAHARSATRHQKVLTLVVGILINGSMTTAVYWMGLPGQSLVSAAAMGVPRMLFLLAWVILVPMLFERRWSAGRPEIVR